MARAQIKQKTPSEQNQLEDVRMIMAKIKHLTPDQITNAVGGAKRREKIRGILLKTSASYPSLKPQNIRVLHR